MESQIQVSFFYFILGFNPCYVGSKMESEGFFPGKEHKARFQSLLCWK